MQTNYIKNLREDCEIAFREQFMIPDGVPIDSLADEETTKWHAFQAGFLSGCQWQLSYDRHVFSNAVKRNVLDSAFINAAFLPDGP